jgi:hypothetical protein
MPAVAPVSKYAGILLFMTLKTGNGLLGHAALYPELLHLGQVLRRGLGHRAAQCKEACQSYDQSRNNKIFFHFYTPFPLQLMIDRKYQIL